MSKQMIIGLAGLSVAGVAAFLYFRQGKQGTLVSPYSMPNEGYQSQQPSTIYPFTAPQAPRVDGSNQPWYGQDRSFQPSLSSTQAFAVDAKATASVVDSLSSIWGDLGVSDWFNNDEVDFGASDYEEWAWS